MYIHNNVEVTALHVAGNIHDCLAYSSELLAIAVIKKCNYDRWIGECLKMH